MARQRRSSEDDRGSATNRCALSVVIPHFNDVARLDRCLDSVARSVAAIDTAEVIVADNGSDIAPADLAALIGARARLVICLEKGAGPARNAGVAASRGAVLAFIDSDCIADERWARAGLSALHEHPGVVGGGVSVFGADPAALSGTEAYEIVFGFNIRDYIERKGFIATLNMFVRRDDFDRVGGFRTTVAEDVEWSWRARATGLRLHYAPDARVAHPARASWAELKRKFQRTQREMFELGKLQRFGRARWLARSGAMPLSILAHAPQLFRSDKIGAAAAFRALGILIRLRLWRFADGNRRLFADLLGR